MITTTNYYPKFQTKTILESYVEVDDDDMTAVITGLFKTVDYDVIHFKNMNDSEKVDAITIGTAVEEMFRRDGYEARWEFR